MPYIFTAMKFLLQFWPMHNEPIGKWIHYLSTQGKCLDSTKTLNKKDFCLNSKKHVPKKTKPSYRNTCSGAVAEQQVRAAAAARERSGPFRIVPQNEPGADHQRARGCRRRGRPPLAHLAAARNINKR
mmetsp:Transcript_34159/g.59003  ORF Transcript_34159/g.59003 Transcript_34159/m.59003 type:complete len:128 (+) Transcript_34159:505-888(+)